MSVCGGGCRCNCGYACGGPSVCKLGFDACMAAGHFKRDCDHVWDGESEEIVYPGGGASSSVTCSKCGESAMSHDMKVGP